MNFKFEFDELLSTIGFPSNKLKHSLGELSHSASHSVG